MNKKQNGFAHVMILLVVLVLAAVGFGGWYVWHKHQTKKTQSSSSNCISSNVILNGTEDVSKLCPTPTSQSQSASSFAKFTGTVAKIDLSAMPGDGSGLYTVKVPGQGTTVVTLASGESSCDRQAIVVPTNVHVGDDVSVSSIKDEGSQVVCKKGTYIRLKQAYLSIQKWGVRFIIPVGLKNMGYKITSIAQDQSTSVHEEAKLSYDCNSGSGTQYLTRFKADAELNGIPIAQQGWRAHLNDYYYILGPKQGQPCGPLNALYDSLANLKTI